MRSTTRFTALCAPFALAALPALRWPPGASPTKKGRFATRRTVLFLPFIARKRRAVGYAPAVCAFLSRLRLRRRRLTRHSQVTTTSTAMPAKPSRAWGALKP